MKEKLTLAVIIAALSGTAFAGSAETQSATEQEQPGASQSVTLQDLDLNQDGYIDEIEATAHPELVNRWGELDANQDGKLDEEEFAKFEPEASIEEEPEAGMEEGQSGESVVQ